MGPDWSSGSRRWIRARARSATSGWASAPAVLPGLDRGVLHPIHPFDHWVSSSPGAGLGGTRPERCRHADSTVIHPAMASGSRRWPTSRTAPRWAPWSWTPPGPMPGPGRQSIAESTQTRGRAVAAYQVSGRHPGRSREAQPSRPMLAITARVVGTLAAVWAWWTRLTRSDCSFRAQARLSLAARSRDRSPTAVVAARTRRHCRIPSPKPARDRRAALGAGPVPRRR